MINVTCYQICYNEETLANCPKEFIPLVSDNEFPDLYEVIPILNQISNHDWKENEMVGFFSPRFTEKTGIKASEIKAKALRSGALNDALLFTSYPLSCAYFLNPWEHGEAAHPGILDLFKIFAEFAAPNLDLMRVTAPVSKTVFSNYFVAKKSFWDEWLKIVIFYMKTITDNKQLYNLKTTYGDQEKSVHPFVIERIPTLILLDKKLKSEQYFWNDGAFPTENMGSYDETLRNGIARLAELKKMHYESSNNEYFDKYWKLRKDLDSYLRKNFDVADEPFNEFEQFYFGINN